MTIERMETRTHLSATPLATIPASEQGHSSAFVRTSVRWNGETFFAVNRNAANFGTPSTSRAPVELWKSGGASPATTTFVKEIVSSTSSSSDVSNFTVVGSKLYFTVSGTSSADLWVSDGTAAGTTVVKSLDLSFVTPSDLQLTSFNGKLYFVLSQPWSSTPGLWTSDGTSAGTVRVAQTDVQDLTSAGGALYFISNGGLWKSNGLANGTALLKSLSSTSRPSIDSNHAAFYELDGAVYFFAADSTSSGVSPGLFKTDGTAGGTVKVAAFVGGVSNPYFTAIGHTLYFAAAMTASPAQLCKTDGTAANTSVIATTPASTSAANLVALGDRVLFTASSSGIGNELWTSDGTAAGSTLLKDINSGSGSSSPAELISDAATVYFKATTADSGVELWKSDGTPGGTARVSDLYAGTNGSAPRELLADGAGHVFFQAVDATAGYSMLVTDGTANGTTLLKDYSDAPLNPTLSRAVTDDGRIFFVAGDAAASGRELYVTDTSGLDATLVADLGTATNPDSLVAIGNTVYFAATTTNNGRELWKSDGSAAGTVLVKDIASNGGGSAPLRDSSNPRALYHFNGTLYFAAQDTSSASFLLWKTDGTANGTVKVTTSSGSTIAGPSNGGDYLQFYGSLYCSGVKINSGTGVASTGVPSPSSSNMRAANGSLWFTGTDATHGPELWKYDPTNGSVFVADIRPGTQNSSNPNNFAAFKGRVYFTANDGIDGNELWSTDGTAAGTRIVKDIYPGLAGADLGLSSSPSMLTPVADQLIFFAFDPDHGTGLWRSDGTSSGTQLVKDMRPGFDDSVVTTRIGSVGGRVYFTADDGSGSGVELWTTDGTAVGTQMLQDLAPGAASSYPLNTLDVNGSLLFTANSASSSGPSFFSLPDTVAPHVLSTTFTITATKHAASVQFSEDVSATLDVSDFTVTENKSGAIVPTASIAMTYEVGSNIAILTFPGYANGLLPNGGYTVSLAAGDAADRAGHLLVNGIQRSFIVYTNTAGGSRSMRLQVSANGQDVEAYSSTASTPTYTVPLGTLDTVLFIGSQAWPDTFTVDMQNGNPLAGATVQLSGTPFFSDIIVVNGSSAAESFVFGSGSIDLPDAGHIAYTGQEYLRFNGRGGGDALDLRTGNSITIYGPQQFASLSIGAEMSLGMNYNETSTVAVGALSIDSQQAQLDLADWDMIVTGTPQSVIESYVQSGVLTSNARFEENTALGVMNGADYLNNNGSDHFDGIAISPTDTLVKYTYFGDVDFNGVVDVSDYNLIDFGFTNHLTGWANGDADYSGAVDVSDYNLIDFAFSTQTSVL